MTTTDEANPDPVPKRRLQLTLNLGADDLDEMASCLRQIAFDLEAENRTERVTTSGGYASGYHLTLSDEGAHVTHDSFATALDEWRGAKA